MLENVINRGCLYVGITKIVPWAMIDKDNKLIGFEIDVSQRLADDMGLNVEFIPTNYPALVPALLNGEYDIVISGLGITPERNLMANCTQPYNSYVLGIAVNKHLLADVKEVKDLNKPEVVFARRGFDTETFRKQYFPLAQCHRYDDDADGFRATLVGETHAIMTLEPKPRFISDQYPDILYQPPELQTLKTYHAAFVLEKGDTDALNFFNNWIFLRNQDGWLNERRKFWFEGKEWFSDLDDNPFLILA